MLHIDGHDTAAVARAEDGLPIGLAHGVRLRRPIARGDRVGCADVDLDPTDPVIKLRETLPSAR